MLSAADLGTDLKSVPKSVDDLDQVHAVALREEAPFVQEGEGRGTIGVLHDLARFALDGARKIVLSA